MKNVNLYQRAVDYQEPLLEKNEIDILWEQANTSMHLGEYQNAFAATEALLCQADRNGIIPMDSLPDPRHTKCAEGRSLEMIQGFIDRVDSLNWRIERQ